MKNLILFLTAFCFTSAFAQTAITPEKQAEIERYVAHFEKHNELMGSISIVENGNTIINRDFGVKNTAKDLKPNRMYQIGSITKFFVGVLYAQLAEKKQIDLDGHLDAYYANMPNADQITIRQMLNHTSGLKDYVVKDDSVFYWLVEPQTPEIILAEIEKQGVAFPAGDSLSYSNSAYYLLARILEQKFDKPFKDIVASEIVNPLGLKHTFGIDAASKIANIAPSYEKENGEWVEIEDFYFPNASGAGDIVSTCSDMNTILTALFEEKFFKKETLTSIMPKENEWFGMGLMMVPFYEDVAYGHGGDTYGTHSVASYNPENKLAITYIVNGESYPTNDFAIGLLNIVYDHEYKFPSFEVYESENQDLSLYTGKYGAEALPFDIKIYEEEGALMAQGEGQPAFSLTPVDEHIFEFKKAGIKLAFAPEAKVMTLEQAGQSFELQRQ